MQLEKIQQPEATEDELRQYLRERYGITIEEQPPRAPFSETADYSGFDGMPERKKPLLSLTAAVCRTLYEGVLIRDSFGNDPRIRRRVESEMKETKFADMFTGLYNRSKMRKRLLSPVHMGLVGLARNLEGIQTDAALEVKKIASTLPSQAEMDSYADASDEDKLRTMRALDAAAERFLQLVSSADEQKLAA